MMQNTKFNESLIRSGLTMYELSKLSGIPYTTINEIHRGKKDINQCATATVYRIAAVLGESTDDIINDIKYLDDVKGRYKGIDYIWHTDETSYIVFEYEGESVTLDTGKFYNIPSRMKYYSIIAGWMIKEHIEHIEWQKEMAETLKPRLKTRKDPDDR